MKVRYWVGIALIVAGAVVATFWGAGSVVVRDPERQLVSAQVITGDGRTQPLYLLPGRFFYTVPKLEGEVEIHCRTGEVRRAGYVSPHMQERIEIKRSSDCQPTYVG